MTNIDIQMTQEPKAKPDATRLGFGRHFTDHMLIMDYNADKGWHDARVVPHAPIPLSPASPALHYALEIFEGLKCYKNADGGLQLFRPKDNFLRLNRSAKRLGIPAPDIESCMDCLRALLKIDGHWTPDLPGTSLYIRPLIIASDARLGLHTPREFLFIIILSPVGTYYASGFAPVDIFVEDQDVRAVRGGLGEAKTGANYAAAMRASARAEEHGFSQVLWLDGVERKYIEEVGAMNVFFAYGDDLYTPPLNGSILPGITRDSVIRLARHFGKKVFEERMDIDRVLADIRGGKLTEAFGAGTAAVIAPLGKLRYKGEDFVPGDGKTGPVAQFYYKALYGIQTGSAEDPMGWVTRLD